MWEEKSHEIRRKTIEGKAKTLEDELIALIRKNKRRTRSFSQYVLAAIDSEEELTELYVMPSLDERSLLLLLKHLEDVVMELDEQEGDEG